jgi:hypothetical protein
MKARWLNLNRLFGSVRFWFGSARFRFKTGFEPIFYNNVVGKCGRMPRSVIQLSIIAGPPVNTHEALEESPRLSGTGAKGVTCMKPIIIKFFFCDQEPFYLRIYVSGSSRWQPLAMALSFSRAWLSSWKAGQLVAVLILNLLFFPTLNQLILRVRPCCGGKDWGSQLVVYAPPTGPTI